MSTPLIEIKLLRWVFKFKPLTWREEFSLLKDTKDSRNAILAGALVEVSGLPIHTIDEAVRLLAAMPKAIKSRVFIMYKGALKADGDFTTVALYRAPSPNAYRAQTHKEETELENQVDKAQVYAEAVYGKQELSEAREIDQQILAGSRTVDGGYRGAKRKNG